MFVVNSLGAAIVIGVVILLIWFVVRLARRRLWRK
jgi:hypothetical protein